MRRELFLRAVMAALAVLGSPLAVVSPSGSGEITWQDPPRIAFERCIGLSQRVGPHPLVRTGVHFLAVTAYEERLDDKGERRENGSSLNVYVVNDLIAIGEPLTLLPLDVFLIVNRLVYDPSSDTMTAYQWLFLDKDRDGQLDNGAFQTVVKDRKDKVIRTQEEDIPGDAIGGLQEYFRTTLQGVLHKAREERGKTCVAS